MGDNFLKQQIRNFEKSTDLAVDVLEREKLYQTPRGFQEDVQGPAVSSASRSSKGRPCTPSSPKTARRSP